MEGKTIYAHMPPFDGVDPPERMMATKISGGSSGSVTVGPEWDAVSDNGHAYCSECGNLKGLGHLSKCSKARVREVKAPLIIRPSSAGFCVEAHFSTLEEAQQFQREHFGRGK